uniref:RNA helicase n=1 Tax=Meloidogyne enterolobii TaxID=390850 RepID=A0A6V7U2L2_MELEN|nr:unnamed protein product [Meloidogyne enterolobii]
MVNISEEPREQNDRRTFGSFGSRAATGANTAPLNPAGPRGRGRGRGTTHSSFGGQAQTDDNKEDSNTKSERVSPTEPETIGPRRGSFGRGNGRGGSFTSRQAEGADGTDFGDRPVNSDSNENNSRGRGGFGGRGRGAFATSKSNEDNNSTDAGGEGGRGRGSGFRGRGAGGPRFGENGSSFGGGAGNNADGSNNDGDKPRGFGGRGRTFGDGGGSRTFGDGGGSRAFGDGGGSRTFGEGGGARGSFAGGGRRFDENNGGQTTFRPYASEEERARDTPHVPVDRTIEDIRAEDIKAAEQYKNICEEDEECVVTGLESATQVLDDWGEANFEPKLKENIEKAQYIRLRKIQSLAIPLIMDGHDVKGHAESGSGKSAAFLLPIINKIMVLKKKEEFKSKRVCPYALIIEPTRELAIQLYDQARKLADETGVSVAKAYGMFKHKENLKHISTSGCDILVGTPGRLTDFFMNEFLDFELMKILVLDEADQLLEDSFARDLRRLTKVKGWPKNEDRQTLLFSATFPPEVQVWASEWLKKENVMVSNRKLVDANPRIIQKFMKVSRGEKNNELLKLLKQEEEDAKKENPDNPNKKRTMVFVKMKRTADVVSTFLNVNGLKSTTINGDRPQKLREQSLNEFRDGKHNIVVTTDVCSRGIDIKGLDHVINLDLPTEYVIYVHRIGRTGRLKEGISTSFFDPLDDMDLAKELVQGVQTVGQEPPEWLVQASEGKLPPEETTPSWNSGVPFGGSSFGGGNLGGFGNGEGGDSFAANNNNEAEEKKDEKENNDLPEKKDENEEKNDKKDEEEKPAATEKLDEETLPPVPEGDPENDDW